MHVLWTLNLHLIQYEERVCFISCCKWGLTETSLLSFRVCILRWNTVLKLMVWFQKSFPLVLVSSKDVYWVHCCLICILLVCHAYLMKLVILLMFTHCLPIVCFFADDLVLLSESAAGLQNCLHELENYCQSWGLNIFMSKTKVVIFNKGGMKITRYKFYLDQNDIEIVQSYCYLGKVFSSCGTFSRAVKAVYDKASKALFAMKKIDTCDNALLTLKLFDTLILPIMTYSIEAWGPYFFDECKLENLHSLKCMSELGHGFPDQGVWSKGHNSPD